MALEDRCTIQILAVLGIPKSMALAAKYGRLHDRACLDRMGCGATLGSIDDVLGGF
jgi:hypothetical protein